MEIKKGDSVLDAGCGTGRQAVNVSRIIGPTGRLTGIDPSSYRIELARKKFGGDSISSVSFLVGQAEDLIVVPDNSIDHAYFCSSFHWVEDKKTALNEIYRVLRPGAVPRKYGSPEEFLKHLEERDSLEGVLKDIPAGIREKIRQEITEEFRKAQAPDITGFGNVTLFAIATKPH